MEIATRNKIQPKRNNRATYLLVHGGWHGSWCWKRVRKALQDAGHEVFTPSLTGVGERSHLNSATVNLSTHIADVVNLVRWEELSDVILCGHSYGGFVISGVADQIPDQVRALVYLDERLEDPSPIFLRQDGVAQVAHQFRPLTNARRCHP